MKVWDAWSMHMMAKKVTLCISIQKEYSLWHVLGSANSKLPSCRESEFCHSKSGSWAFQYIFPDSSCSRWGERDSSKGQQWLHVRTSVRCDRILWPSFTCFPLRKTRAPRRGAQLMFTQNEGKSWHGGWPVPSSGCRGAFWGSAAKT